MLNGVLEIKQPAQNVEADRLTSRQAHKKYNIHHSTSYGQVKR